MSLKFPIDHHDFDWSEGLKHVALLNGQDVRDFNTNLSENISHSIYGHFTHDGSRADRIGRLVSLLNQRARSHETHWSQHSDLQLLLVPNLDWIDDQPKQANQLRYLLDNGAEHGFVVVIGRSWKYRKFRKRVLKPIADKELIFYHKCGELILE